MTTNVVELKRLGQFFHDIRLGRQVTLTEAAGDWSPSSLSRFERGEHDLSAAKAVAVMGRLGVEATDFFDFYQAERRFFPMRILNSALSYHSALLTEWHSAYQAAHPHTTAITAYAEVLYDTAAHWADPNFHFTAAQEQILADCLAVPENFVVLEMDILKLIVGPASHELLVLLKERISRLDQDHPLKAAVLQLIIWLGALMSHDLPVANELGMKLAPLFTQKQANWVISAYYPNWHFGVLATRWLLAPSETNTEAIDQLTSDLLTMHNPDDAYWFKNMFKRLRGGQVTHNPALVDHPQAFIPSHTVGEVIRQRRKNMRAKISDLDVGVSPSTLRRFENGETQLNFSTLVHLMGELGLLPSQVLTDVATAAGAPVAPQLTGLLDSLPEQTPAVARRTLTAFRDQTQAQPPAVLNTQLFVLQMANPALQRSDAEMKAQAQTIFTQLMNAKMWYCLELFAVRAITPWLPTDQLTVLFNHGHHLFLKNPPMFGVISYFFDAIRIGLVHVTKTATPAVAKQFHESLRWVTQTGSFTRGALLAEGAWLVAAVVNGPTAAKQKALQTFLAQAARIGHTDVLPTLQQDWANLVPAAAWVQV